ncbi:MAG: M56 family metallopeptidase [Gemmatimonadota bacterium]|nr:M56 family metallopeptidase [Gemmatimonadota bacterium]
MIDWMLYAALVSALLGIGAVALEQLLLLYRRPTRPAWIACVLLSVALPIMLPRAPADELASPIADASSGAASGLNVSPEVIAGATVPAAEVPPTSTLSDTLLRGGWVLGSVAVLVWIATSDRALRRGRRRWRRARIAGIPILVSASTGPAVVGFLRPAIVLPEWVLSWQETRQRLIVEHEAEHLRAGDPRLLLASLLALVLCPWNPVLWWQVRRLRLAVEVDCDARVLRHHPDARGYGALLLEVGRFASGGNLSAAAFSKPHSFLERRIRMMTRPNPHHRFRTAISLLLLVLGAPVIAFAISPPEAPRLDRGLLGALGARMPVPRLSIDEVASDTMLPQLLNRAEVQRALQASYPSLLRDAGITGTVRLQVYTDARGQVRETRVIRASHQGFAEAAQEALSTARFAPTLSNGKAVPDRFPFPVTFVAERAGRGDLRSISNMESGERAAVPPVPGGGAESMGIFVPHAEAMEAAFRAHHPGVAEQGTGDDYYVWFLIGGDGSVLQSGLHALTLNPSDAMGGGPAWNTETVREELLGIHPGLSGAEFGILRSSRGGRPLNVAWIMAETH